VPELTASIAAVPIISTGIRSGRVIREISAPEDLSPMVKAPAIDPIKLSIGVPMSSVPTKTMISL
jgi:hypothetical protein